jgi:16S rRNA (adenine1518-N6/adenine1519-N6)-dimethyltransferase
MSKFSPKKYLGQNFLANNEILKKISNLNDFNKKVILEIGPGKGALTKYLLKKKPQKLIAIEKDLELKPYLLKLQKEYPENLEIIYEDALKFDYIKIKPQRFFIVANLPYNIATTLIINWLKIITKFESIIVMVQREVAQRISAKVSTKYYGRISILIQLHADVKKHFDVSPENFNPKPKVTSSVIELRPKQIFNFNYDRLDKTLKLCFSHRRKKLKNNLKKFDSQILEKISDKKIDINLRPQNVEISQYIKLSKLLI